MKHHRRIPGMILAALTLSTSLILPAFAAQAPANAESPWYEGVTYVTEKGIASNLGDLDENITVREWAVMVCRAYGKDVKSGSDGVFGTAEVELAYKEGWMDLSAMMDPDSAMCRRYAYESIFYVEGIPAFDAELYAENVAAYEDRFVRAAKENELCEDTDGELDLITRGEAAQIIYLMQTKDITVEAPALMEMIHVDNVDQNFNLNAYLLEIQKVPEEILKQFHADGWSYRVDRASVDGFGDRKGTEFAGVCSYANKSIYVKYDYATVHEFGHYYHNSCDDTGFRAIYDKEAEAARAVLGDYAATNEDEYFAEAFDYWINWNDDSVQMSALEEVAPETYEFFHDLAMNNWVK